MWRAASPESVIRAATQNGLIAEPDARAAMDLIDDRNLTSHTYAEALAIMLFARSPGYVRVFERLLAGLENSGGGSRFTTTAVRARYHVE